MNTPPVASLATGCWVFLHTRLSMWRKEIPSVKVDGRLHRCFASSAVVQADR